MRLLTIGFTKKPAQRFFDLLRDAGVKRVVDMRLSNSSQPSGLRQARWIGVVPAGDQRHGLHARFGLRAHANAALRLIGRRRSIGPAYEQRFPDLMRERRIEEAVDPDAARRRLPALPRRSAPPMPPPPRRRVLEGTVG